MTRRNWLFSILLFFAFVTPILAKNSRIPRPTYRSIEKEIINLEQEFPDWVDHIRYGSSVKGRKLHLLRLSNKSLIIDENLPRKAVYIDGAIHGQEYLNIEDRLARYFLENKEQLPQLATFLNNGGVVYIVPIVNPDGFLARTRRNAKGKDLNRDFPLKIKGHRGLSQPETRQLVSYLEEDLKSKNLKIALSMNYHCCAKSLLTPWSVNDIKMSKNDVAAHQEIGEQFKNIFNNYRVGKTSDILKTTHAGTAKDYFYESHHALAFTFEGRLGVENQNLPLHIELWERIFSMLNR